MAHLFSFMEVVLQRARLPSSLQNCRSNATCHPLRRRGVTNDSESSGRKVITVCSPKHNELVKSRGADVVYDYVSISDYCA